MTASIGALSTSGELCCRPMPKYPRLASRPIDHFAKRQKWPRGHMTSTAPMEAEMVRRIAERLHKYKREHYSTQKSMAKLSGVSPDALSRLMRGETWGTLSVIARLEDGLQIDLWCDKRHKAPNER